MSFVVGGLADGVVGYRTGMSPKERQSPCLPPDRARDLVVELEKHGVESSRIDVVVAPARSMENTSRVDQTSFARPVSRAALGLVVGAVAGVLLGLIIVSLGDLPVGTVLGSAIAGALLGALFGLYRRLPVNTDVVDVDAGSDSIVRVDVGDLDDHEVNEVEELISEA